MITGVPVPKAASATKRSFKRRLLGGVQHQQDDIHFSEGGIDRRLHPLGQQVAWFLETGQVEQHHLPATTIENVGDAMARRLRHPGNDGDLFTDQHIDQRRLAHVGASNNGDEA